MSIDEERPRPSDERGPGGNDVPPSGEEARAQSKETTMPLIWLVLGALVIALFVVLLAVRSPHHVPLKENPLGPVPALANPPHKLNTP